MDEVVRRERSPGIRLLFVILVGLALSVPLLLVYALVYDRQDQANTAQASINAGWGGAQVLSGPLLVVPFRTTQTQNDTADGKTVSRVVEVEKLFYIAPQANKVATSIVPEERRKSIYRSVLYSAAVSGEAHFALPPDLERYGVSRERLEWDRAELRFGVSDARGLTTGGSVTANGKPLAVQPGKGPAASNGQGFFAFLPWDGQGDLTIRYDLALRGSGSLSLVPRGGSTSWTVRSAWPSPSFAGAFLPERPQVSDQGFTAQWTIDKLALGQPPVGMADFGPPADAPEPSYGGSEPGPRADAAEASGGAQEVVSGQSAAVTIGLVEPVNLYSKVNRAVKYGFLFIGFTFLAYFLFDVVGGARVATAEYLLTGAGLVLFFALLLAFAEVIGFTASYVVASGATIALLSAYSAAVLRSRRRAGFMGALLVGLYALLFVLLNLEAWSLLIGSVMLFVALAGVMYITRNVEWGTVGRTQREVA